MATVIPVTLLHGGLTALLPTLLGLAVSRGRRGAGARRRGASREGAGAP
jgi:hypothetical protein